MTSSRLQLCPKKELSQGQDVSLIVPIGFLGSSQQYCPPSPELPSSTYQTLAFSLNSLDIVLCKNYSKVQRHRYQNMRYWKESKD